MFPDERPPKEPRHVAHPPDAIIKLSHKDPGVALNIRPHHWPKTIRNVYQTDGQWQIRNILNNARLVYPLFSRFILTVRSGDKVLISCQDAEGGIAIVSDAIQSVSWSGHGTGDLHKGYHPCIQFEKGHRNGAPFGKVWGSFVLAMSKLDASAPLKNARDQEGHQFVEMFSQFGGA